MNTRIELLISAISWLTVIGLIAAIISDALRRKPAVRAAEYQRADGQPISLALRRRRTRFRVIGNRILEIMVRGVQFVEAGIALQGHRRVTRAPPETPRSAAIG
jgi:hypothetical protein